MAKSGGNKSKSRTPCTQTLSWFDKKRSKGRKKNKMAKQSRRKNR